MVKKIGAVLLVLIIAFVWVITLRGVGNIGPLQKDIKLGLDISGGVSVLLEADTAHITDERELERIMNQTQSVIERRVNEMGMSDPIVTIEGTNRMRVELPGVENAEEATATISQTAQLKFLLADGTEVLTGADIRDSNAQMSQEVGQGPYVVTLEFTSEGGRKFYDATSKASSGAIPQENIMQPKEGEYFTDPDGNPINIMQNSIVIMLDENVISAPGANKPIDGSSAEITGSFTKEEAQKLSMLIRGGALPVSLQEVQNTTISATLGIDALKNSIVAGVVGCILVFLLMLLMYRLMGLAANIALMLYIPGLFWTIVLLDGVLTLPGIAGIILSVGMAVDANVIIFARIKEEVGYGKSVRVATSQGFKRAMATIIDSQLTTLIAGVVLYQFGTGPVRGFALTLIIGIIIGMITAVVITWLFVQVITETKFLAKPVLIGVKEGSDDQGTQFKRKFNYLKHRKKYYIITVFIIVLGISVGLIRGFNFGIDFTGGTMIQIDMNKVVSIEDVNSALEKNGIDDASIVHYNTDAGEEFGVIIKTTKHLDAAASSKVSSGILDQFGLDKSSIKATETFGPSVGELLKKNAVIAILVAALGMLIYIVIRFRWRFGVASIVATFHDVFLMIAFYGLFHMTVNNPFIAAVLTIVGYSINDTIVIFDRVRENRKLMSRKPIEVQINTSIDQTLVRSLMTSFSTFLAVLPLVILGGEAIREFAVPLMVGILCGASSSIFIASPIYYELTKIGQRGNKYTGAKSGKGGSGVGTKGKSKKSKSQRSTSRPDDGAVV